MHKEIIAILKTVGTLQAKTVAMSDGQEITEQLNIVRKIAAGLLQANAAMGSELNQAKMDATEQLEFLRGMICLNDGNTDDVALLNIAAAASALAEKTAVYLQERNRVSKRPQKTQLVVADRPMPWTVYAHAAVGPLSPTTNKMEVQRG